MRTFKIGDGEERKFVVLEVRGSVLRVTQGKADGSSKRSEKDLPDEAGAQAACKRMADELLARGYVERRSLSEEEFAATNPRNLVARGSDEQKSRSRFRPGPGSSSAKSSKLKTSPAEKGGLDLGLLADAGEDSSEVVEAPLARLAPMPAAQAAPKKKSVKKKKKKKKGQGESSADPLDTRVIAGVAAIGLACLAFVGYLGYAAFLKPPTIVGHWEGSRTEHEIGKFLRNTQYVLILDDKKNASMSVQGGPASGGTYALHGDRLRLSLKGEEGEASEVQYKITLGGSTLDLFDPESGKKVVQLIRFHERSIKKTAPPAAAPADLAKAPADKGVDQQLASVRYAAKDGAFAMRQPAGWESEDGSRADNSYSWVRLTKGSAKIQVFADVAGSLVAGPNSSNFEEGSPMAPVHGAHERYKRTASELYGDYQESEPALFKGSGMGEGRIATFTASTGGVFGSKVRGIRVTLLTNDRRISILCEAPPREFDKLKDTFLATCRSLSR